LDLVLRRLWFWEACGFEKLVALSVGGFFVLVQFYNQPLIFSLLLWPLIISKDDLVVGCNFNMLILKLAFMFLLLWFTDFICCLLKTRRIVYALHTPSPSMSRFLFACCLALLLLLLVFQTSNCKDTNLCAPSSCGNHTINYPFSLESDPSNCGNPLYTLHCEKNTSTVLYLDSRKYYVQAINYNNLTIRVVDPGVKENDCSSLPDFSLTYARLGNSRREYTIFTSTNTRFDYIRFPYTWFQYERTGRKWFPKYKPLPLSQMMIFINCANPVNSPLYVETGTCLNGEKSSNVSLLMRSYVNVGGMKASDLMELCSLERMTLLPAKDYKNMSYKEIHSQLAYGFELSWHKSKCGSCATICYIDDSNRTKCAGGQYWVITVHFSMFKFFWHESPISGICAFQ